MIGRPANDGDADAEEQRDLPDRVSELEGAEGEAHPSRQSRRGFLGGMAGMGIGVGTATPGRVLESVEEMLSQVDEEALNTDSDTPHDPHTVATFDAIIDAVIPNTQDDNVTADTVGEPLGRIHQYGGLDSDMTAMCIDILNDFMSPEVSVPKVANTGETAPLSEALSAILDTAASELIASGNNEDEPQPNRFGPAGGPFASLSRTDRFRALYRIEKYANDFGKREKQFSEATGIENGQYSRTGSFVVALAVVFPPIVYYSDMNGYDDFIENPPSERDFDPGKYGKAEPTKEFWGGAPEDERRDTLLGWAQTGYPGITQGHDVLLGYELDEEFEATGYGKSRPSEVTRTEPFWRNDEPEPSGDGRDDGLLPIGSGAGESDGSGWSPFGPSGRFTEGGF